MDCPLSAATEAIVRRVWASRLGVPLATLGAPGFVFVTRSDTTAVVAVKLGQTVVVTGPHAALAKLELLEPERMLDMSTLLMALDGHAPKPLGSASLAYADGGTVTFVGSDDVRAASEADAEEVLSACSRDEREESGLDDMGVRLVAPGQDGAPAVLAGYEPWSDAIAHMGVAVRPAHRRHGLAQVAAATAAHHAIVAGLVPQWRCRLDNMSSARLRDRLGFVELGIQLALEVSLPEVGPPCPEPNDRDEGRPHRGQ